MTSRTAAKAPEVPRFQVDTAVFLVLFYLYVWRVVDPRLVHHSLGIQSFYQRFSFHTDWAFLQEHLSRVGGPVEYLARLLSQCCACSWLGALTVTALAWGTVLCADSVVRRGGRSRDVVLRYVPAAIVLVMYSGYNHPVHAMLSLLAALAAHAVYVRLAPPSPARQLPALLLTFLALYWLAGAGSLLFPILVAVDELVRGGRKPIAAAAVLGAAAVPWGAALWSGLPLATAYGGGWLADPGVPPGRWSLTLALYLFFPTVLAGTVLWGAARLRTAAPVGRRRSAPAAMPGGPEPRSFPLSRGSVRAAAVATFFLALGTAAWISQDALTRSVLEIDWDSQQGRWTEVLRAVDRLPAGFYTVRCHRNTMLALYHTGRLGDEMFSYPQRPGVDLYYTPKPQRDRGSAYQESRLFLELGQVNHAERCAYEALAASGEHPAVLEQLAVINAVKGRSETAAIFLKALEKHLFHRRSARDMLRMLQADPRLESDPRVSRIRKNMSERNLVLSEATVEDCLQALLDKNPENRMAFELLMAHYLSAARPDKIAEHLPRLQELGYRRVPRHYQEALVMHGGVAGQVAGPGGQLDPEVLRRAREFRRICAAAADPREASKAALAAGLSDSFFFFATYGVSGR